MLKRESGQFWPSIIQDLPNVPTALYCDEDHLRIFVGLVTGAIMEYQCQQDLNSIILKRQWVAHAGSITGLIYSGLIQQIFSCGKDRNLIWHCSDSANKIGNYIFIYLLFDLGNYVIDAPCSTMEFDGGSKFIFMGDTSGSVYVMRIVGNSVQLVSKMSAHTGSFFI